MIVEINKKNQNKFFKKQLYQFTDVDEKTVEDFFNIGNVLHLVVIKDTVMVIVQIEDEEEFQILGNFELGTHIDYIKVLNCLI